MASISPPQGGDRDAALRIMPGPKSIKYGVSFTTTTYADPALSGSGLGVPEPRTISFVCPYNEGAISKRSKNLFFIEMIICMIFL
jgi:hypothetical protein